MPVDHYENFPVASWLLPRALRSPIEAIYAFARGADDIADEGASSDEERLAGLVRYSKALDAIEAGETPTEEPFARLAPVIREHQLPIALFRDLVDAFAQDVVKKRYRDFAELLEYCRRSANPIGRLLLHLFKHTDRESLRHSDAICSSLQLINFWQDVEDDWAKGRVYIPLEDLARFAVDEAAIGRGDAGGAWKDLMAFECARARGLLVSGKPLGASLPGRAGLEIRTVIAGGARILDKIDAVDGDVFAHRPILTTVDWITMLPRAVFR